MAEPDELIIERGERYDILRFASQNNWESVRSLVLGIADREGFEPARILTEARDEAGSNALHYAARAGKQGKYMLSSIHPFIHPSILSFTHPFIYSFTHPFTHPFIHPSIPRSFYPSKGSQLVC